MEVKEKAKKNSEYLEYRKIVRMIDFAHKKALAFTKTDFQKKLEKVFSSC